MLELLELFAPYMLFISFFVTVVFNLWLVSIKSNWIVILIANLLLILIMEFLGLAEYNFLNKVLEWFFDFIARIITGIFEGINDILKGVWDNTLGGFFKKIKDFFDISPDRSYGGGGGGFRTR
jgi:hypothetical protein